MEILFSFDKEEPLNTYIDLRDKYGFDDRDGLSLIMLGIDAYEVGDKNRLIHQIECQLNIDLALLDYWNNETYSKYIEIDKVKNTLRIVRNQIIRQPLFYENIHYDSNIASQYLKHHFLNDINFLIDRMEMNQYNGAEKVKYSVEW